MDQNRTESGNSALTLNISIENISAEFEVFRELDLHEVASNCINTEYKFGSGLVELRLKKPPVSARIFAKGKIVTVGALSVLEARTGCRRIARLLQRCGIRNIRFKNFRVNSIMAAMKLPFGISLDRFYCHYQKIFFAKISFLPELENFLKLKLKTAQIQIWSSGSLKMYAQSTDNLTEAVKTILPMLTPFRFKKLVKNKSNTAPSSSSSSSDSDEEEDSLKHIHKHHRKQMLERVVMKLEKAGKHAFDNDDSDTNSD